MKEGHPRYWLVVVSAYGVGAGFFRGIGRRGGCGIKPPFLWNGGWMVFRHEMCDGVSFEGVAARRAATGELGREVSEPGEAMAVFTEEGRRAASAAIE